MDGKKLVFQNINYVNLILIEIMEDLPMGVKKTFFIGGLLTDLHSEVLRKNKYPEEVL